MWKVQTQRLFHVRANLTKLAAVIGPLCLTGCASGGFDLGKPHTVGSRDKAAAVLVAPTMVAPWSDVSAALKPGFTMTGDSAVPLVLPVTEGIQQSQLDASSFSLAAGLPQSSTSGSSGTSAGSTLNASTTGGVTTTTSTLTSGNTSNSTTTTSPGVVPTAPSGIPAGGALPASGAASALALDPVLKYKSAYYLNQTVQLLNQEIDNVARRRCYIPYVVRLKLAVMPYQPALSYSAHAHIAFLSGEHANGRAPDPSLNLAPECLPLIPATKKPDQTFLDNATIAIMAAAQQKDYEAQTQLNIANDALKAGSKKPAGDQTMLQAAVDKATATKAATAQAILDLADVAKAAGSVTFKKQLPIVVPLLAADDLDVAMRSQSSETARQLGFALNFMIHGIGGSAGANAVKQQLQTLANQDLSSALTISRDNDNTLYVEIAAANTASGLPTLIGQTYDVAVLLLVPRSYFGGIHPGSDLQPAKIGFVSSTDFRDATDGKILSIGKWSGYLDRFDQILKPYANNNLRKYWKSIRPAETKIGLIVNALDLLQQADYDKYLDTYFSEEDFDALKSTNNCNIDQKNYRCFPSRAAPAIWAGLIAINDDSPNKYGLFEAPIPLPIKIPAQTVLLSDDGSSPIQAVVGNVTAQSVASLTATLHFTPSTKVDQSKDCTTTNTTDLNSAENKDATLILAGKAPKYVNQLRLHKCTQVQDPAQKEFAIPMTIGALNLAGHTLALTMPSLGKMNIKGFAGTGNIVFTTDSCNLARDVCATLDPASAPETPAKPGEAQVDAQLYVNTPPTPGLTVAPGSGPIVIGQGGTGALPFMIGGALAAGDDGAYLTVSGADLVSVLATSTSAAPIVTKAGFKLTINTAYTLNLANLTPGATVTVKVQGGAAGKADTTAPGTASFVAVPAAQAAIKP